MITKKKKLISIIMPCYKMPRTIVKNILYIQEVLEVLNYRYEIIVVVDGTSIDSTYKNAAKIKDKKIKVLGYKDNMGKGYAVRFGMNQARGDVVIYIDSDLDINPNGISMLLAHFDWYGADIIVGSKLHPVSKVKYPIYRLILSWGYRSLVKLLFGLNIKDTQVGLKVFKKNVLSDVLPRLMVKNYAFDIEILAVSNHLGYKRIYEAPIELDFKGVSSMSNKGFWNTVLNMLIDTLAVFYRLKVVGYYDNKNRKNWTSNPLSISSN